MNTLNKETTKEFFKNENGYNDLVAHWSKLMQDKEARKLLRAEHHLFYLVLRGKDWRKAFTPATNPVKLANGLDPEASVKLALYHVFATWNKNNLLSPFNGFITADAYDLALAQFVPGIKNSSHPLQQEAYD